MKTINFTEQELGQIRLGNKTQTRRPIKNPKFYDPDYLQPYEVGDIFQIEDTDLKIKITDVRFEKLQEISEEDSFKEGIDPSQCYKAAFVPIREFNELWNSIYGDTEYKYKNNPLVWVIDFEVVE